MQQRFTHSGSIYEDAHTVGDVARRRNVPITKLHGATFYKMLDLKGGMYHATSGRRDNDNLGDDSQSLTEVSHLLEHVARAVQQQIAAYQNFWNACRAKLHTMYEAASQKHGMGFQSRFCQARHQMLEIKHSHSAAPICGTQQLPQLLGPSIASFDRRKAGIHGVHFPAVPAAAPCCR